MADLLLLSEAQMRRIEPYFPLSHAVARVDDRRVIIGIVFVIRNGLRWRKPKSHLLLRGRPQMTVAQNSRPIAIIPAETGEEARSFAARPIRWAGAGMIAVFDDYRATLSRRHRIPFYLQALRNPKN